MGKKRWVSACQNLESTARALVRKYDFPLPIAQFFVSRGIKDDEISGFLNPRLNNLSDPYRFPGMKTAVARLWLAIKNREPILIHGDYDTDGVTATALLSLVLRQNGGEVYSFIPHRFDDGYGFTPDSLKKAFVAIGKKCNVLITVDCGITSNDAVAEAKLMGIDTIITDHHESGQQLPDALAIINPKIHNDLEDLHVLSGAGMAFKLSHAFIKYGRENNLGGFVTKLEEILDYVALGTVADIVPILGENRIMVKFGIDVLKKQIRPGIRALIESSKLKADISPSDITFKLAPRINAAGRVGNASTALSLLETSNIVEAYDFAKQLENYNSVRQEKEQQIFEEAKLQIKDNIDLDNCYSILIAGNDWHPGVIGIVASRLARDYNRPVIVLTIQGEHAYGSGRSIGNLNLVDALYKTSPLLERFGGHPMAVGIGLKTANIKLFAQSLESHIREKLCLDDLEEQIVYDGEIELEDLTKDLFTIIESLSPFGHGNQRPVYRFNGLQVTKSSLAGNRHARGVFQNSRQNEVEFIAFNHLPESLESGMWDIVAIPQLNSYYNDQRIQLQVVDFRLAQN
jgi:single-stranded-DNA-specific exonuclease